MRYPQQLSDDQAGGYSAFRIEQKISRQVMRRIIDQHKVRARLLQHMVAESHERVIGANIAIHNQKWVRREPLECPTMPPAVSSGSSS